MPGVTSEVRNLPLPPSPPPPPSSGAGHAFGAELVADRFVVMARTLARTL